MSNPEYTSADATQPQDTKSSSGLSIDAVLGETNIAKHLDEKKLVKIGNDVVAGYKKDLESRRVWEQKLEEWTKLALQVSEEKVWPWRKASNVKYPILSIAAMQFNARAYGALVPSDGSVVKVQVVGSDPQGQKAQRAYRVQRHMSYQLLKQMSDWEEEMDKLLLILPIVGTCFKKTYWDSVKQQNCSRLVLPKDLIINYWAKSMEDCERKTERIEMTKRVVKERQLSELFLEADLKDPPQPNMFILDKKVSTEMLQPSNDDTTPFIILEQHTFADLDDDGYSEPYIITVEEQSQKVLRIVARFDSTGVKKNDKDKIIKIDPIEYYTKFGFIPNPDGGFYDIGFGLLLGSLNAAVDTTLNQLIDAGTLANLQAGFIGKGLRVKMGDMRFNPGEWKAVNATGDDLRKAIFPLPTKEPSDVLFKVLEMVINSCKELSSIADIMVGKMPGQNTPATTTQISTEQGMKIFTAIYKRIFRSLSKEYKKLFRLNRIYLDPQEEVAILDEQIQQSDYEEQGYDICPDADPNAVSQQTKDYKAHALLEMLAIGTLDPMAVTMRVLDAQEQPNPKELIRQGPPPPDPEQQKMQMEAQISEAQAKQKMEVEQMKAQLKKEHEEFKLQVEQQKAALQLQVDQQKAQLEGHKAMMESIIAAQKSKQEMQQSQNSHHLDLTEQAEDHALQHRMTNEDHMQAMAHAQEQGDLKTKQMKEQPKGDKPKK